VIFHPTNPTDIQHISMHTPTHSLIPHTHTHTHPPLSHVGIHNSLQSLILHHRTTTELFDSIDVPHKTADPNHAHAPHTALSAEQQSALPAAVTTQVMERVEFAAGEEMALKFERSERLRLAIGRFLSEVVDTLQADLPTPTAMPPTTAQVETATATDTSAAMTSTAEQENISPTTTTTTNTSMPALCCFFAHDTTLGPLLLALGAFDGCNPPLGSSLAFELYRDACDRRWVRALYNGVPLWTSLPISAVHAHEDRRCGLLPLDALVRLAHPSIPVDWLAECGQFEES
jgi:Histidine phosphatase superfamily (branch 2)